MWKNDISFQKLLDSVGKDEIWMLNLLHLEDTVDTTIVRNIQKSVMETKKSFYVKVYLIKSFFTDSSENQKQNVEHSEDLLWCLEKEEIIW